jgi:Spy/CpxP family protein refolding chaperone
MKKLYRIVLITAAMGVVFGLALATASEAQPGPRGLRANDDGKPAWGRAALNLTDDQKDELSEMRQEQRQEAIVRRGTIRRMS